VYARHVEDPEFIGGREPFGPEHFGLEPFGFELKVERLNAEGLMGCLAREGLCASGVKSPVCEPSQCVEHINKTTSQRQVNDPELGAGGRTARLRRELSRT